MPLIDTLALKTGLLNGGMPEAQASAIVDALANADTGQLATKADIADVNGRIDTLHAEVNGRFDALQADMNGRFDALYANLNGRTDGLTVDVNGRFDALKADMNGRFDALNGKLNLLLAFFTPLLVAVLALLWRAFFR